MELVLSIYLFLTGAALGSFILVVVDRTKAGKDWVKGRSHCEYCKHTLAPIDLIPIVSWLLQRGACRYCRKKLSIAYPLVELGLGLAVLFSYVFFPYEFDGAGISLFILWVISLTLGAGLFIYDLRWQLLPNKLVYPLILTATLHRLVLIYTQLPVTMQSIINLLSSLFVGAGIFWILFQISKGKWIGYGDVRLGVAIGLLLPNGIVVWFALLVASILGLLYALPMVKDSKKALSLKVPFGPFLLIGLYVAYLFGDRIINWYVESFLFIS